LSRTSNVLNALVSSKRLKHSALVVGSRNKSVRKSQTVGPANGKTWRS